VQPAASEDGEPVTEAGPKAAESVTISMRPIPYPPAAAAPPAGPVDLERTGVLVDAYRAAADAAPLSCHLPVALLAAIGQIESGSAGGRQIGADHRVNPPIYGPVLDGGPFAAIRDTDGGLFDGDTSWDRAVGPMQFVPGTWWSAGVDGDGDGLADPQNVYDAAHAAAGYLCRANRDLSQERDLRAAIWSYNHSSEYVTAVIRWMQYFTDNGLGTMGQVGFLVTSGGRASELTDQHDDGGGHADCHRHRDGRIVDDDDRRAGRHDVTVPDDDRSRWHDDDRSRWHDDDRAGRDHDDWAGWHDDDRSRWHHHHWPDQPD
jgi:hypothetical protein